MYYVYILQCRGDKLYIGQTSDLIRRIAEHKRGEVYTTKRALPVELVYYEAYKNEDDSKIREKSFKHSGSVYNSLVKRIVRSLGRGIS